MDCERRISDASGHKAEELRDGCCPQARVEPVEMHPKPGARLCPVREGQRGSLHRPVPSYPSCGQAAPDNFDLNLGHNSFVIMKS